MNEQGKIRMVVVGLTALAALTAFVLSGVEVKVHALECAAGLKSYGPLGYEWPCK